MNKLMIVDDSNIIRNKISKCESAGNNFKIVATAKDGIDAIRKYKSHQPNVVTMDLTMPRMEGLDCIRELISLDPELRILVVSAISDKATGIKALELGAHGFLCKPFSDEDLLDALHSLMED